MLRNCVKNWVCTRNFAKIWENVLKVEEVCPKLRKHDEGAKRMLKCGNYYYCSVNAIFCGVQYKYNWCVLKIF